jgi:hypothetical protein
LHKNGGLKARNKNRYQRSPLLSAKKGKIKNSSNIKLLNPHRRSPGTQDQHMNQEGQTELQVTLLKEKQQYKTH